MKKQQLQKWKWPIVLLLLAILLGLIRYFLDVQGILRNTLRWIDSLGAWAPVLFVLLYIPATVLFLPGFILTVGAGVLFGVLKGSIIVSVAATLGATAAFLIGRYLARDWVAQRIRGNSKFEALDEAVAQEGWKIVGLTRLSPIFPFNLLNYAFGLTQVTVKHYFFASWAGMLPGTVMYVYIGSIAGDLATLGTGQRSRTTAEWILYTIGLIATIVLTVYITRVARRALEKRVA